MSLRDELARRLATIFVQSLQEPTTPSDFPSPTFYDMGPVADECLRLMEWARRRCVTLGMEEGYTAGGEQGPSLSWRKPIVASRQDPLTIAPLDWNPLTDRAERND